MSWLITNKSGKMVGVFQSAPCHVNCGPDDFVKGGKCDQNGCYYSYPMELEAIGFSLEDDDKRFSDEDVEVVQQLNIASGKWKDVEDREYLIGHVRFRRIILRKKQPVKPVVDKQDKNKYLILIEVDDSCKMARVSLNGSGGMEGNYWDFHPGCHGLAIYGDFEGHIDLSRAIYQWLVKVKKVDFRNIKTYQRTYSWKKGNIECSHEGINDTGVGYYHCPSCEKAWTYDEWNELSEKTDKQGEQDEMWLELFKDLDRWSRSMKGSGDTKIKIKELKSKYIIQKK